MAAFTTTYPFPPAIHIKCDDGNGKYATKIQEFRSSLVDHPLYSDFKEWLSDEQLLRFLVAKDFVMTKSHALICDALKWRSERKPHEIERQPGWQDKLKHEAMTGKIYIPGKDKYGRSVVVFDNTVQNTTDHDDQINFLAWNLEFAIHEMSKEVDKYVIFMHLNNFSLFNCPAMATTRETIRMLCSCYCERLGHCVCYLPPSIFHTVFNALKSFVDPKTVAKLVFITGDVSENSENDLKLKEIIGDNWAVLTGAKQPVISRGCSPGFDINTYWPNLMERVARVRAAEAEERREQETTSSSNTSSAESTDPL